MGTEPNTNRKNLYHISHFDLDGVVPLVVTDVLNAISNGEYNYYAKECDPNALLTMLKAACSDSCTAIPDLIIITDLRISKDTIEWLWTSGNMRKTIIMDHHQIDYDPIEYSNCESIMNIRKENGTADILPEDHIYISSEINGKPTCGTDIYLSMILNDEFSGIFNYDIDADSNIITSEHLKGNNDFRGIDIEKLKYLKEVVRLWDTHTYTENEESFDSIDAVRLNTLFHTIDRRNFLSYIEAYLCDVNLQWQMLTFGNEEWPAINHIVDNQITQNKKYVDRMSRSCVIMSWTPKALDHDTREVVEMDPITIGIVICDHCTSTIASEVLKTYASVEVAVTLNGPTVTLYSRKDTINVGKIAELYGGGGHKEAAGFRIAQNNLDWMIRNYFTGLTNLTSNIVKVTTDKDGKVTTESYG